MAVAFDGFSIRAFTAKIRSVDVAKCWPFKEDNESDAFHLPPIAVAESRWWAHELTRLRRSDSGGRRPSSEATAAVALCPVCRDFSAATVDDVNAHIDECLSAADRSASESDRRAVAAMLSRTAAVGEITVKSLSSSSSSSSARLKLKPTKKRSIAEIFAVAPQIDSTDQGDCFGDGDGDPVDVKKPIRLRKNGTTVKKKKRDCDEANWVGVLNNTKKLKKKKIKSGSIIAIKKKAQKFKRRNHVKVAKKLKKLAKDILNSDLVCGKKTSGNCLSMQDKQNVSSEPSRSFLKNNQEPTLPTRSILKNRPSFDLTAQNVERDFEANPCGIVSSERHVRFSGKDDILGPTRKDNDGPLLSHAVAASSETVKSAEENNIISMDFTKSESSGTEVQRLFRREKLVDDINNPLVELPSSPSRPITVPPNTSRVFPEIQGSSNDNNNVHLLESGLTTGGPRLFFSPDSSRGNAQGTGNVSTTPNFSEMFVNRGQDCFYTVAGMSPVENRRRFPEPVSFVPASESESNVLRFQPRPDEEIINDQAPCFRPYCRPHPMEWKENAVVLRRNVDESFFGLPLNSQGELIQSSPGGKCLYNEVREANVIGSSNGFLPANSCGQARTNVHFVERQEFPSDHHRGNCSLENSYARESRGFQLPARLGVTYWESSNDRVDTHRHDFDRRISHSLRPVDSANLMNISFDGTRSYGQVHNQKMNGKIHPNENSGKASLSSGQPTVRLMGKDVQIGRSSKETKRSEDGNVWTDKEMILEHCQSASDLDSSSLTRNFQEWIPQIAPGKCKETVPAPLPLPPQTHFLVKTPGPSYSHRYHEWQQSTSPSFLPFSHLPTSASAFNGAPHLRDFFISEAEPLQLRSQFSMPPPNIPHDPFEHVQWGTAVPHYFSKPGFEFPHSYRDSRPSHAPSPWFQASNGLPSWLLHAKQQRKTPSISSQPQHISSRTNILNTPSVYRSAEGASYSHNLGPSSHHQGTAPFVITGVGSNPGLVQTGYRTKLKERSRSKGLGVKDLYPCKKFNKSRVPKSAELLNPTRSILNLDELGGTVCYSNETQNNRMRSSGNDSPRLVDGAGKSGPIKLSAGVKHILTPTQNVDHVEDFVPVHSTIPFVVETSLGSPPHQSLKKATKIYRF